MSFILLFIHMFSSIKFQMSRYKVYKSEIKQQLMKHSYLKHKTAAQSKKNSNISSVIYKDIGEAIQKEYQQKMMKKNIHKQRDSIGNVHDSKIRSRDKQNCGSKDEQSRGYRNSKASINGPSVHRKSGPNHKYAKQEAPSMKEKHINNFMQQKQKKEEDDKESVISQSFSVLSNKKTILSSLTPKNTGQETTKTSKKTFDYKYIIGKGGFGKVWKVEHKKNRNQYAMKQMLKSLVMTKKSVQSVMNQKALLANLNSPFIVNMHYAFQDRDTLYLVLDLLEGGDLRHHLSTKNFSELQAKFFISCIVLGLEYLHDNKVIHRDIKPENLVLDSRGYIRITDLGIARIKKTNNSSDTSGTPGYMSPEVICRMNHSYASDFFAVGVIAYELATGRRPYNGYSRNQIRQKMLSKQVQIRNHELSEDWSLDAVDFINKLLMRKPQQRLGFNGINQLKTHPWIRDLNWKKLASKEIESPFIPFMKKTDFDQDQQITIEDEEEAELIEKNSLLLRKTQFQQLFKQYTFDPASRKSVVFKQTLKCLKRPRESCQGLENINPVKNNSKKMIGSMGNSLKMTNSTKASNSSIRRVNSRRQDTTVRSSKETILNTTDYNETIPYSYNRNHHNYEQHINQKHHHQVPQKSFFK